MLRYFLTHRMAGFFKMVVAVDVGIVRRAGRFAGEGVRGWII